jgi:hypothetical protein
MCKEFEHSHFAAISEGTIAGYLAYLKHMKAFFGGLVLTRITTKPRSIPPMMGPQATY